MLINQLINLKLVLKMQKSFEIQVFDLIFADLS